MCNATPQMNYSRRKQRDIEILGWPEAELLEKRGVYNHLHKAQLDR